MTTTWEVKLEALNDAALRAVRDRCVCEMYEEMCRLNPNTARTTLFERMTVPTGLTSQTIRYIVTRHGMQTSILQTKGLGHPKTTGGSDARLNPKYLKTETA